MEQKLGRGLSALFGDNVIKEEKSGGVSSCKLHIDLIESNENQPRKSFDSDSITELAASILQYGVLQPIMVRKLGNQYKIIAGERRWRAAKLAGLSEIPVQIIECNESDVLALALIENIQREDLNSIEEAEALHILIEECGCRQEDLGVMLSKSRSYITNSLRLLSLQSSIKELIKSGKLSAGHGRSLIGVSNAVKLAEDAVLNGWSVRYLENVVKCLKQDYINTSEQTDVASLGATLAGAQDLEAVDISHRISAALGIEAKLKITRHGGFVMLYCKSYEELEALIEKLVSLKGNLEIADAGVV
jgi:ParB family chromosome partitioning protein